MLVSWFLFLKILLMITKGGSYHHRIAASTRKDGKLKEIISPKSKYQ